MKGILLLFGLLVIVLGVCVLLWGHTALSVVADVVGVVYNFVLSLADKIKDFDGILELLKDFEGLNNLFGG
jgi:hypothetical protein